MFLAFWVLYFSTSFLVDAQSDSCTSYNVNGHADTDCLTGEYKLPVNFDVNQFHTNITNLAITSIASNVVYDNYTAFPLREKLDVVKIWFFNELPEHPRFPLAGLLSNNRQHIRKLNIRFVKLMTLTETDFRGFNRLQQLEINFAYLTSVSVQVFGGLGVLPSGLMAVNYKPKLEKVIIGGNSLYMESLDWGFLAPVADSVQEIGIEDNGLATADLICSIPFLLKQATAFNFGENPLHKLPSAIYATFNPALSLSIYMDGGRICPNAADCSCCEMRNLAVWLRDNNQTAAVKEIECGAGVGTNSAAFLAKNTYSDCGPAMKKQLRF